MQYCGGYFFGNRFGWRVVFFTFFPLKEYSCQLHYGDRQCSKVAITAQNIYGAMILDNKCSILAVPGHTTGSIKWKKFLTALNCLSHKHPRIS